MIESVNNEKIIRYSKLHNKKYREEEKLFIVVGKHLIEEALKKDLVKEIFVLNGYQNNYNNPIYASERVMKKLANLDSAPNELAIVKINLSTEVTGNVCILDDIADPGNLGTIIRSAVAFNYETIVISKQTVDPYNIKCIRASEGMFFNINIVIADIADIIKDLKEKGYIFYGTDVVQGTVPTKENNKHAIIIGSEARGMHLEFKKMCDKLLYIPMNKKCESLNAGVSASILMYELSGKL